MALEIWKMQKGGVQMELTGGGFAALAYNELRSK